MLDPLTAFGLAGNVVQIVDFSIKLVSKGYQIRNSLDGSLPENHDTELVAVDLKAVVEQLSSTLDRAPREYPSLPFNQQDAELIDLCQECKKIGEELIARLGMLKGGESRHRQWKSIRQALKVIWEKDKVDSIARRLKLYRDQLNTRILVSLRERLDYNALRQLDRLDRLDQTTRSILDDLYNYRQVFTSKMEVKMDFISLLVIDQHEKTREVLKTMVPRPGDDRSVTNLNAISPRPAHLANALASNDWDAIRSALRNGADINTRTRDSVGYTALNLAARAGYYDDVLWLLNNKADVNAQNSHGWTSLAEASCHGRDRIVDLLIRRKADIDKEADHERTPLHLAVEHGQSEAVRLLLENGADIEKRMSGRFTPLLMASQRGHVEIVRVLLSKKANINAQNHSGWTPVAEASHHGHLDIIHLLLAAGADPEIETKAETPLVLAVWNGHTEIVRTLLSKTGNFDRKNNTGKTALCVASEIGHEEIARALLQKGASHRSRDKERTTPLIYAAIGGYTVIAKMLLDAGADVEATNAHGISPIKAAVEGRHRDIALELIYAGALDE